MEYEKQKCTLKERWNRNKLFFLDFYYWKETGRQSEDGSPILQKQRRTFIEKTTVVLTALVVDLIYNGLMILFLTRLLSQETLHKHSFTLWNYVVKQDVLSLLQVGLTRSLVAYIFFACILAPVWEELAFRWYWFSKKLRNRDEDEILKPSVIKRLGRKPIYPIIIITSLVFGVVHGGAINILLQGFGGFVLSYVYLRNGRSLASGMILHSLFNASLILISYLGAKDSLMAVTLPYWLALPF
ncbi:MAG: hypothetical protein COU51_01015 [Parcubacteria group bacterium CG10_big_fil_rev_8_21_14_0_10_36_14]|nr:MAG: hypothetical protein COU51_01015 [Parcubacteria group bacterium CG10_big_fil_rev_8_21_14_0_10_36_14]